MREDAKAFVDRPHEWNGIHTSGMPAYLLGGDYVKTFNDDKVADELGIEIHLTKPATLYVLLDERVSPPDWLLESFENTGDQIGVDEAHMLSKDSNDYAPGELRIGAGSGVNRKHSIWRLVVQQGGVVSMGANGPLLDESPEGVRSKANMYGVVAVPLGEEN